MSNGPFDTEAEVREFTTWAPVMTTDVQQWRRDLRLAGADRIERALNRAGVEFGMYDRRILSWVGGTLDPAEVEVVASVIERAYDAGYDEGQADGIGQPLADPRPDAERSS